MKTKHHLRGVLVALGLLLPLWVVAQTIDLEKTYKITGASKRGALANVEYNKETGYTLTYVTKSNDRMARFQIYTFDKDFNFINMVEDEQEFEKAKTKYKWFRFKGEEYSVEGMYVEPNLIGTLVLRKKQINYKYDWLFLGYYTTTKVLEKVKPRTDDGRTFFYYTHAEDDATGDVCILVGARDKKDPWSYAKNFSVLRYNTNLDLVKEVKFSNEYPQSLAFSRTLVKDNPENPETPLFDGMVFVFAPMGGPGMGKYANENRSAYTYVRVNENLEVVDNIPFQSYASYWKIDELIRDENDNVYLYGPSAAGKDKYFQMSTGITKFKAVQLMKISNHKIEYFTETNLEEFQAKLQLPPSQKKSPEYEGKKFDIANYYLASNGDFFVVGQNFEPSKEGNKYKDVLGFQFDSKGNLKAQYGIDTKESNKYAKAAGAPQSLIESADGKYMYWLLLEVRGVTLLKGKVLTYPRIGKIDIASGKVNDFLDVRGPDDDYYLDPQFPYIENEDQNQVVFFGSDKPGRTIWFVRIKVDN
jgi:hypothetical protein